MNWTPTYITVADYIAGGAPNGEPVYLQTAHGLLEVTSYYEMADGPWLRCGKANAGFGLSFAVTPDQKLQVGHHPVIGPPIPWDEHEAEMAKWFADEEPA